MGLDGLDADVQSRCDLLVEAAFGDLLNDLTFTMRQAARQRLKLAPQQLFEEGFGYRARKIGPAQRQGVERRDQVVRSDLSSRPRTPLRSALMMISSSVVHGVEQNANARQFTLERVGKLEPV